MKNLVGRITAVAIAGALAFGVGVIPAQAASKPTIAQAESQHSAAVAAARATQATVEKTAKAAAAAKTKATQTAKAKAPAQQKAKLKAAAQSKTQKAYTKATKAKAIAKKKYSVAATSVTKATKAKAAAKKKYSAATTTVAKSSKALKHVRHGKARTLAVAKLNRAKKASVAAKKTYVIKSKTAAKAKKVSVAAKKTYVLKSKTAAKAKSTFVSAKKANEKALKDYRPKLAVAKSAALDYDRKRAAAAEAKRLHSAKIFDVAKALVALEIAYTGESDAVITENDEPAVETPADKPAVEQPAKIPAEKPATENDSAPSDPSKAQSLASINQLRTSLGKPALRAFDSERCFTSQVWKAAGDSLDGAKGIVQHENVVLFTLVGGNEWLGATYTKGGDVAQGTRGGELKIYICN